MHNRQKAKILYSLVLTMAMILTAGCEIVTQGPVSNCVNCHMDKDILKEIADPIETTEDTGEG